MNESLRHDRPAPNDDGVRSRWSTVGWAIAVLAMGALLAGLLLAVKSRESAVNLAGLVADGTRPEAPVLPVRALDDARFDTPAPGSVVVVNFWASWCGPCREEAPALNDVAERHADDGVVVVGVNAGAEDTLADARGFVRQFDVAYPVARGTRAEVERWGVRGYPETWVVGRDGRIAAHVDGPLDAQTLGALVERELEREPTKAGA